MKSTMLADRPSHRLFERPRQRPLFLVIVFFLVFHVAIGTFAFQYGLWALADKDVPIVADVVCGVIGAQVVVPLAVICWVFVLCDVPTPIIPYLLGTEKREDKRLTVLRMVRR